MTLLIAVPPVRAQSLAPRGDADCSTTLTAADVVSSVGAVGGAEGCANDDCDRDGQVTGADVDCAAQCLFGLCPTPDAAPRITSITPEFGSGIAPFSTVRVLGTGFGPVDDPKFVTIGGLAADVVGVVDADTLLVFVPPLDPGPAEIVVNAGLVDGFPFPLTIAEAAPVGEPDSFDGVMTLIDDAVDRFSQLPLESVFGEDTASIRQEIARALADLAARRADLAADPGFTAEVRAMSDAAFDRSGVAEELRQVIGDIDALIAGGAEGGGAQKTTAEVERLRKAMIAVLAVTDAAGLAIVALAGAPAAVVVALAAALGGVAILLDAGVVATNPPRITRITFTDAGGTPRSNPTGGGTARVEGMRFLATDTVLRIDTPRVRIEVAGAGLDGALVATLPESFGLCGPVEFRLARTRFGIKSNAVSARVQPELLDVPVDRARIGQPISVQVRGTAGCSADLVFRRVGESSDSAFLSLQPITNRAAQCLLERGQLLFPERTYRLRVQVDGVPSREEETLEIVSALTGVSVSCDYSELQLPPESPNLAPCTCGPIPEESSLVGTTISFATDGGTLGVSHEGEQFADIAAKGAGEGGTVTCTAKFKTNRALTSQPFTIKVVDKKEPTVTLSEAPAEVDPGASVDLSAVAEDNDFVTRIVLRAMGDAVVTAEQEKLCTLLESNCTKPFAVEIKRGGFSNRQVTVQAEAFDASGNKGTSMTRTFNVRRLTETTAPVVTIQSPQNGGRVRPGDMVQVSVRVTDDAENDSGVEKVRVDVTGPAVASGLVPPELTLPMPLKTTTRTGTFTVRPASELANISDRTITIKATGFDAAGNMASSMVTVNAGGPPIVTRVVPNPVVAGANIRIFGDGFGESQGSSIVEVGLGASSNNSWSNTEILAKVPEGISGLADVDVIVDNVRSNIFSLTVLGSGDVRLTLIWDDMNDLDLAVTDPTGATIDFDHRFSDSGGALDIDANRNCGVFNDPPRENIFYRTGAAPTGTYNVKVTYFAGCTEPTRPSEFRVELAVDGRARTLLQGTLAPAGTATASFMRSGGN